jgi:hypothetical protein
MYTLVKLESENEMSFGQVWTRSLSFSGGGELARRKTFELTPRASMFGFLCKLVGALFLADHQAWQFVFSCELNHVEHLHHQCVIPSKRPRRSVLAPKGGKYGFGYVFDSKWTLNLF